MNKILRGFSTVKSMKFIKDKQPTIKISELPSGIKIFIEQTAIPFASDIGICFKVRLISELPSETGSLFSLNQHMYLFLASGVSQLFSDAQIFGLRVQGPSTSKQELYSCLNRGIQIIGQPISDEEF